MIRRPGRHRVHFRDASRQHSLAKGDLPGIVSALQPHRLRECSYNDHSFNMIRTLPSAGSGALLVPASPVELRLQPGVPLRFTVKKLNPPMNDPHETPAAESSSPMFCPGIDIVMAVF
jgi:hypothetical protein